MSKLFCIYLLLFLSELCRVYLENLKVIMKKLFAVAVSTRCLRKPYCFIGLLVFVGACIIRRLHVLITRAANAANNKRLQH